MRINHALWIVALVVIGGLGALPAAAKPNKAPVRVECTVPAGMRTGDEADVVLRFRALGDLQRLDVTVFGDTDLEVVSDGRDATFRDLARGGVTEMPVRVRLTGPKWGALSVTFRTQTAKGPSAGALNIVFGDTK